MRKTVVMSVVLALLAAIVAVGFIEGIRIQAAETGTYVGSAKCKECHDREYATWRQSNHAKIIENPKTNAYAIKGDFVTPDKIRNFKKEDVAYTHGIQWKQRYIKKNWQMFPAQWNYDTQKWVEYKPDPENADWRFSCGYCHTTGFNRAKGSFKELNVACEACHGPGSKHVENRESKETTAVGGTPDIINPRSLPPDLAAAVCGQCHNRGTAPDGKPYPQDYLPGMQLSAKNFSTVAKTDTKHWWPDGSVKAHRQQYPEWKETLHAKAGVTCISCHEPHQANRTAFSVRASQNDLCLGCHPQVSTDAERGHAPVGGTLRQHSDCIGCHMSAVGKSAEFKDERTHRFKFIAPIATINLGGGDTNVQPNSCNICHKGAPVANLQADFAERLPFRSTRP